MGPQHAELWATVPERKWKRCLWGGSTLDLPFSLNPNGLRQLAVLGQPRLTAAPVSTRATGSRHNSLSLQVGTAGVEQPLPGSPWSSVCSFSPAATHRQPQGWTLTLKGPQVVRRPGHSWPSPRSSPRVHRERAAVIGTAQRTPVPQCKGTSRGQGHGCWTGDKAGHTGDRACELGRHELYLLLKSL